MNEGKPFDLTKFVKSYNLTMTTGFTPEYTDDGNLYFHEYKPPPVEIDLTFENDAAAAALKIAATAETTMKMEHRGKYWFDPAFETDIVMTGIEANPDGSYSADFKGVNIIDKTNKHWTARFLRWILRR